MKTDLTLLRVRRDTPGPIRRTRPLVLAAALGLWAGFAPAMAADASSPGRTLAQRQGCLGCHAVDAKLVGPSYQSVAERYAGQKDASAELAKRIRAGGSGHWGDVPMPPQGQLTEAEARRLSTWILAGAK
jgi:cytochrome c